jgi:DNA-binding transcriptional LysR family regulator
MGQGISVLPDYICQESIDNQKIIMVEKNKINISNTLWLCYKKIGQSTTIVERLLDTLDA